MPWARHLLKPDKTSTPKRQGAEAFNAKLILVLLIALPEAQTTYLLQDRIWAIFYNSCKRGARVSNIVSA